MPLIIPANSITGGYEVDNSLRFDDGSSDYLNRTPASASNRKTWTFSAWVKRGVLDTNCYFFGNYFANNDSSQLYLGFNTSNQLRLSDFNNTSFLAVTNQVFRDVSAWYHIVLSFDTTQGTSTNRWKIYVNGEQITSFASSIYPSLNFDTSINTAQNHFIGYVNVGGYIYDGYMSEVVFIDGQQLDPTDFGEFDDSGIWKPIAYTGTYGTNGFYLDFENSGSLGADVSGNGNNFTVNNLTSIDQTTDTPTNNFATLISNFGVRYSTQTYSEGNLKVAGGAGFELSPASIAPSSGKWYFEAKMDSITNYPTIGFQETSQARTNNFWVASTSQGYGLHFDGTLYNNNSSTGSLTSYTTGDIMSLALDLDNGKAYFGKNGTWLGSADPSAGTNPAFSSIPSGTYYLGVSNYGSTWSANFGNPPFTISSGNSDANGYGNFEYAVPSGYYALCTKNLSTEG